MRTLITLLLLVGVCQAQVFTSPTVSDWRKYSDSTGKYLIKYTHGRNGSAPMVMYDPPRQSLTHYDGATIEVFKLHNRDTFAIGSTMTGTYVPDPGCFEDVPAEWVRKAKGQATPEQASLASPDTTWSYLKGKNYATAKSGGKVWREYQKDKNEIWGYDSVKKTVHWYKPYTQPRSIPLSETFRSFGDPISDLKIRIDSLEKRITSLESLFEIKTKGMPGDYFDMSQLGFIVDTSQITTSGTIALSDSKMQYGGAGAIKGHSAEIPDSSFLARVAREHHLFDVKPLSDTFRTVVQISRCPKCSVVSMPVVLIGLRYYTEDKRGNLKPISKYWTIWKY